MTETRNNLDLSFEELCISRFMEGVLVYDKIKNEICFEEDLHSIQNLDDIIIIPTEEELYDYGKAMQDYLDLHELTVPCKTTASSYLYKKDMLHDFYDYRNSVLKSELSKWLEKNHIPVKIIED